MSNTRQPGYYWVKYDWKGNGQPKWCIAEWCMSKLGSGELYWHMPGFSTQDDNEFQEINEARILSPDEMTRASIEYMDLVRKDPAIAKYELYFGRFKGMPFTAEDIASESWVGKNIPRHVMATTPPVISVGDNMTLRFFKSEEHRNVFNECNPVEDKTFSVTHKSQGTFVKRDINDHSGDAGVYITSGLKPPPTFDWPNLQQIEKQLGIEPSVSVSHPTLGDFEIKATGEEHSTGGNAGIMVVPTEPQPITEEHRKSLIHCMNATSGVGGYERYHTEIVELTRTHVYFISIRLGENAPTVGKEWKFAGMINWPMSTEYLYIKK